MLIPSSLRAAKKSPGTLSIPLSGQKKITDAIRLFEQTPYRFLLSVPDIDVSQGKISVLEKELDRFQIMNGVALFRGDPFSFTVVIGYLWAKLNEITNIRVIARCREAGMPDELMESEIFYV